MSNGFTSRREKVYDNAFYVMRMQFSAKNSRFSIEISESAPPYTDAVKCKIIGVTYINCEARVCVLYIRERMLSSVAFHLPANVVLGTVQHCDLFMTA